MTKISKRSAVEPFHAMDVLSAAGKRIAAGHPVISLAVGQPSHPAPKKVIEAAIEATKLGKISYTDALGVPELRIKIAQHYKTRYGVDVAPERVAVTTGSSAAFNLAFLTLFDPGDCVAITRPGYPAYRNIIKALGLVALEIPVTAQSDYTLTPEVLEKSEAESGLKISGVLLASPANPTGTVTGRAQLKSLLNYCDERGISFISDEIYHGLTYAGDEVCALECSNSPIIINSFSKYYCMTGWRIGWMILPEDVVRPLECIAQSLYISAPEISQLAAIAAFDGTDEMELVKDGYRKNQALFAKRLPKMGFKIASPMDGAFYSYVDVSKFTNDSMSFAKKMLEEINVAATPGHDFDPIEGHHTMRFSFAGSTQDMEEALNRIEKWLGKNG